MEYPRIGAWFVLRRNPGHVIVENDDTIGSLEIFSGACGRTDISRMVEWEGELGGSGIVHTKALDPSRQRYKLGYTFLVPPCEADNYKRTSSLDECVDNVSNRCVR